LSHASSPFCALVNFQIGLRVFAQAGLEPLSSQSLPPERLRLQAYTTTPNLSIKI
jgi:hypothetical protein